jgi:hypothetical protein
MSTGGFCDALSLIALIVEGFFLFFFFFFGGPGV